MQTFIFRQPEGSSQGMRRRSGTFSLLVFSIDLGCHHQLRGTGYNRLGKRHVCRFGEKMDNCWSIGRSDRGSHHYPFGYRRMAFATVFRKTTFGDGVLPFQIAVS